VFHVKQNFETLVRAYAGALDLFGPAVLKDWAVHENAARRYAERLPEGVRLLDVGSGGGLPGVVIAAERPDVHVVLCERRQRRAAFLRLAVARLGLGNAEVFAGDVRDFRECVGWISAQAVADLPTLVALVQHAVPDRWHLLTRRPNTWYPPGDLMNYDVELEREALDDRHDLVVLTLTARGAAR